MASYTVKGHATGAPPVGTPTPQALRDLLSTHGVGDTVSITLSGSDELVAELKGVIAAAGGGALPLFPIISRNQAVTDSGGFAGVNAATNAVDSEYGFYWRSVTSPNGGTPQWLTIDLRSVPAASKTTVWAHLMNSTKPSYEPGAATGSQPTSSLLPTVPADYVLQKSTAAGTTPPAVNDASWTNVITAVTNNVRTDLVHTGINLSDANWFRFYCTRSSGITGSTDDVRLQIDLRDASTTTADSIVTYGDSVAMEAMGGARLDNQLWSSSDTNGGSVQGLIESRVGRTYTTCLTDVSTGGWTAAQADTSKVDYIGAMPHKYVMLMFGKNDANNAGFAYADKNDTQAQSYKTHMQALIDYVNGLGKIAILTHTTYGNQNAWTAGNIAILNQIIDDLAAANSDSSKCRFLNTGTNDLYTLFQSQPQLLRDGLHPTWDPTVAGGLYQSKTGYDWYHDMIVAGLQTLLYT